MTPTCQVLEGDALARLRALHDESVHCCVTSPPYWGLRDYGVKGQLGLERTPDEYVAGMVDVFREVRRVLRKDGTLWLNIGDSYAATTKGSGGHNPKQDSNTGSWHDVRKWNIPYGLKPKDLVGIPWRLAFAMQADGWWLRSDIIWHKPNPMPESITDRPTKAHEYLFLLSKSERYYFDQEAVKEPAKPASADRYNYAFGGSKSEQLKAMAEDGIGDRRRIVGFRTPAGKHSATDPNASGRRITENVAKARANGGDHDSPFGLSRNIRSVWSIPTNSYKEAHFATFPTALVKPCILAGCPLGGTVLDPFGGSGTTGQVALELGRSAVLIELSPKYCALIRDRLASVTPGLPL